MSQKLTYKVVLYKDMDQCLIAAMHSLQYDQMVIAGLEVDLEDLRLATGYVMDMIQPDADPTKPTPLLDR